MANSSVERTLVSDGFALAEAGRYADAILEFEKENVGLNSGRPTNYVLAKCYYLTNQYKKAFDHLDQAIAEHVADSHLFLLKLALLRDVVRYSDALQRVLKISDLRKQDSFDARMQIVGLLISVEKESRVKAAATADPPKKNFNDWKARFEQVCLERWARWLIMRRSAPPEPKILYLQENGNSDLVPQLLESERHRLERRGTLSRIISVETYASQSGDTFMFRGPPDTIHFAKINDWRENASQGGSWIEGNSAYVAALRDVTVSARSDFIFGSKGELISDSHAHPLYGQFVDKSQEPAILLKIGQDLLLRRKPVTRRVDRAIHLCGFASGHYGHWFSEYLPRLRHFERLADFSSIPILVNKEMPPTHFEFLSAICDNTLIRLEETDEVQVGELLVAPTITFYPFSLSQGHEVPYIAQASWSAPALAHVRDRVLSRLHPPAGKRRAIYLSRRNSTWAKVTNEAELEDALVDMGVEPIFLEKMSFADQVACMQNASLIVSHTGSALNSVVFASPDTRILVFTHAPTHNWGGWLGPLCELGFDPKFLLVPIEDTSSKHVNMKFDVEEICASIRAIMEN
jgi:capsular polysaccharide biosynthesis protein